MEAKNQIQKRELKFRAWDDRRLTYSLEYTEEKLPNENLAKFFDDCYGCTIQQYTGLEDKNGKEIYEGDIVLTDEAGWKGIVTYERDRFICTDQQGGFSSSCNWEKFEVIGNIYHNSEILQTYKV